MSKLRIRLTSTVRSVFDGPATWAMADQGVVSLGTFLTSIILARTLDPTAFGGFALIFGVMLVMNNLHGGMVIYPLLVKGAESDREHLRCISGRALRATIVLAGPQALILTLPCWYAGVSPACSILVLVVWQIQETLRRTLGAHLQHVRAVAGDSISYLGQVAAVWGLWRMDMLTVNTAFAAMAITSSLAALIQANQVRPIFASGETSISVTLQMWLYGRWVVLTHVLGVAAQQAFPWALATSKSFEAAAAFQAMATLVGVSHPIMFSAGNLIAPAAARAMATRQYQQASTTALKYSAQGAALLAPYFITLLLAPGTVIAIVYGERSPYVQSAGGLRLFVLYYTIVYAAHMAGSLLNGMGRSFSVSMAHIAGTASLLAGIPLAIWGGLEGALAGLSIVAALRLALQAKYLTTLWKNVSQKPVMVC